MKARYHQSLLLPKGPVVDARSQTNIAPGVCLNRRNCTALPLSLEAITRREPIPASNQDGAACNDRGKYAGGHAWRLHALVPLFG